MAKPKPVVELFRAWERIGQSEQDRARWLLDFATRDLDVLTAGDTLNTQWEYTAFLQDPEHFSWPWGDPDPLDRVRKSHSWLHEGLGLLAQRKEWLFKMGTRKAHFLFLEGGDLACGIFGNVLTNFREEVFRVLYSVRNRLRFCPECGRLFVARKRQAYCTVKCSQKVRTRKYRAKDPERARRLRRATYERKQQRDVGPNVRVSTRRQQKVKGDAERHIPARRGPGRGPQEGIPQERKKSPSKRPKTHQRAQKRKGRE